MRTICPHCNHARPSDASVPDWQCPACHKAYAKGGRELPPASLRTYSDSAPLERRGGGRWLVFLLVLAAVLWLARPLLPAPSAPAPVAAGQPEVVLYATDWCGYCRMTREFFASHGIRYVEHDIEKSAEALAAHRKLGGNGVPLIVVDGEVINGYNEGALRQMLAPWLRP